MFHKIIFGFLFLSFSRNVLGNENLKNLKTWQMSSEACSLIQSGPATNNNTLSPINWNTKKAIPVRTTSPVVLQNVILTPLYVTNTGTALEAIGNPVIPDTARTYGGVLCGQIFIFSHVRFIVNPSKIGSPRSYYTINGQGTPLALQIFYFNRKYGSFKNALNYRDGLVIEDFALGFSPVANILFFPVQLVIILFLLFPKGFALVPAGLVYAWFYRLPLINFYYATLGSYVDLETGKHYECAINIIPDRIIYVLSKTQFLFSFALMRDWHGNIINNTQPLYPSNSQILKGEGLNGLLTLI